LHAIEAALEPKIRSLMIRGTRRCFAGNYNAPLPPYAQRLGNGGQLIISGNGEAAQAVDSKAEPLQDVVLSTDESGGKTTRIRYSCVRGRYRPISCEAWEWKEKVHCKRHWKSYYPVAATSP
jgi:hypothetical protein